MYSIMVSGVDLGGENILVLVVKQWQVKSGCICVCIKVYIGLMVICEWMWW